MDRNRYDQAVVRLDGRAVLGLRSIRDIHTGAVTFIGPVSTGTASCSIRERGSG